MAGSGGAEMASRTAGARKARSGTTVLSIPMRPSSCRLGASRTKTRAPRSPQRSSVRTLSLGGLIVIGATIIGRLALRANARFAVLTRLMPAFGPPRYAPPTETMTSASR